MILKSIAAFFLVACIFGGRFAEANPLLPPSSTYAAEDTAYFKKYGEENIKATEMNLKSKGVPAAMVGPLVSKVRSEGQIGKMYDTSLSFEQVVTFYEGKGYKVKQSSTKMEKVVEGFKISIDNQSQANPDFAALVNLSAIHQLNPKDFKGKTAQNAEISEPSIKIINGFIDPRDGKWKEKVRLNILAP